MTLETKSRSIRTGALNYHSHSYLDRHSGSNPDDRIVDLTGDWSLPVGTQITASEGHPFKSRSRGFSGDLGGPFWTTKKYVETPLGLKSKSFTSSTFDGFFTSTYHLDAPAYLPINPASVGFPSDLRSSDTALNAKGATAVARSAPTNSVANASTFLGELVKDGLPNLPGMRLWKEKIRLLADAGDEFLNVTFGWLPLISDITQHAEAVRKADAVMKQYERDAGKMVRRNYHFPTVRSYDRQLHLSNVAPFFGHSDGAWGNNRLSNGDVYRTVETVRSAWFSGAFTYHLPDNYDSRRGMSRAAEEAKRVFGLELTPEVLWNLAPWSWAIDWFANAGDVVHNLSQWQAYGLVLRYGYVMEHTINKVTYSWESRRNASFEAPVVPLAFVTETKVRNRANPFGFGVSWDGLNPLQTAIATALGLSRT